MDSEDLHDHFPHVRKAQLREHFDVVVTRKVKETRKRFYSVTLRGNAAWKKKAQAAVQEATEHQVHSFLHAAGGGSVQDKGTQQKGKGKPSFESKGKDTGKGKVQ